MHSGNRRDFLFHSARALGGVAMVGMAPGSVFAVRRPPIRMHDESIWSMGTSVRLSIPREAYAPLVLEEAVEAVRGVDRSMSVHRDDSELSRLNASTAVWHQASASLLAVSRAALRFGDVTNGALDVTVLPVLRRLGFMPGLQHQSQAATEVVDYRQLRVDDNKVFLSSGGYAVDFGGIAKGFAVDEAISCLRRHDVDTALIDAGGDLYGMGRPESNRRWRIGIRDPFQPDELFATLEIENEAVATSGIYAQTRQIDGETVSHIIDPSTGRPVDHVASATVIASNTMEADALATAISVLPVEAGVELVEARTRTEAIWVLADRRVVMTSNLKTKVHLL